MVVSLVTGEQRRTVRRMQQDLDLQVPIEAPRLDEIQHGGHRIGDPATQKPDRRTSSTRPVGRSHKEPRPGSNDGQSVYVANLPWGATADDIHSLFGRYGEVHEATIITDRRSGRSKGFGFVDMPKSAARTAVEALNGSELGGRDLKVRLARPRNHRS